MASAETIESIGDTRGGGNMGLHCNTCRLELHQPFHTWPTLLTTTNIRTGSGSGPSPMYLHHNHHHTNPLQAICLSYPLPYPHTEGQDEPHTHQQLPALSPSSTPPSSPHCNRREEKGEGFLGAQSGLDRDECQEVYRGREPLPDLLPQNGYPSLLSPHHSAPREEAVHVLEVRKLANQLKAIGDEFNATVLRRVRAAPHRQDWRLACRGLFNFVTQTLSTLYRLT